MTRNEVFYKGVKQGMVAVRPMAFLDPVKQKDTIIKKQSKAESSSDKASQTQFNKAVHSHAHTSCVFRTIENVDTVWMLLLTSCLDKNSHSSQHVNQDNIQQATVR